MEITEGKFYFTREGKVVGPIERTPNANYVWIWRARSEEEKTWLHWTVDGKWFQGEKESPRDLMQEVSDNGHIEDFLKPNTEAPASMTKKRLLELAIEATADRGLNYGKPEDNFSRIAAHWNAFLFNRGIVDRPEDFEGKPTRGPLTSADVALMCALLKIARLENSPTHQDSWVDLAGYAACGAEIALAPSAQSSYNPNKFSPSTAEKLARKQD